MRRREAAGMEETVHLLAPRSNDLVRGFLDDIRSRKDFNADHDLKSYLATIRTRSGDDLTGRIVATSAHAARRVAAALSKGSEEERGPAEVRVVHQPHDDVAEALAVAACSWPEAERNGIAWYERLMEEARREEFVEALLPVLDEIDKHMADLPWSHHAIGDDDHVAFIDDDPNDLKRRKKIMIRHAPAGALLVVEDKGTIMRVGTMTREALGKIAFETNHYAQFIDGSAEYLTSVCREAVHVARERAERQATEERSRQIVRRTISGTMDNQRKIALGHDDDRTPARTSAERTAGR